MVMLLAYLKMTVDSHLETTANDIEQKPDHPVEHTFKWGKIQISLNADEALGEVKISPLPIIFDIRQVRLCSNTHTTLLFSMPEKYFVCPHT